jgi:hypothetical protein
MRLQNETELENTRRKLAALTSLILKKEQSAPMTPAADWSLETMRAAARQLRAEIEEYERAHQTA